MSDKESVPRLWGTKRYHTLNHFLRHRFGQKVFKIPINAGLSCPNRDGTLGWGGCLFCSAQGSGDFAGECGKRISAQFAQVKPALHRKWEQGLYIAYFQAFSNTYASPERLDRLYREALEQPGVVGLAIATRPDCLPDEVVRLLAEYNRKTYLWVELGLQTIHDRTARVMKMGYGYEQYLQALNQLNRNRIEVVTHLILGLPGENHDQMLSSAETLAKLPMQGIKLHLLHLMKGTGLAGWYREHPFHLLEREEYVELLIDILEILPPQWVIHRLTGDSPRELLIGPAWSLKKWEVLNAIDRRLEERQTWQGRLWKAARC